MAHKVLSNEKEVASAVESWNKDGRHGRSINVSARQLTYRLNESITTNDWQRTATTTFIDGEVTIDWSRPSKSLPKWSEVVQTGDAATTYGDGLREFRVKAFTRLHDAVQKQQEERKEEQQCTEQERELKAFARFSELPDEIGGMIVDVVLGKQIPRGIVDMRTKFLSPVFFARSKLRAMAMWRLLQVGSQRFTVGTAS